MPTFALPEMFAAVHGRPQAVRAQGGVARRELPLVDRSVDQSRHRRQRGGQRCSDFRGLLIVEQLPRIGERAIGEREEFWLLVAKSAQLAVTRRRAT